MRFMLDTNICIYAIKQQPTTVLEALRQHEAEGIGISAVTAAELWFGVEKSGTARNRAALKEFLSPLEVAEFDHAAARVYGRVRQALEAAGKPIGPLDTQIAAHALALDLTLVTHNTREFARVKGLSVVDWAK